jgi:hypothetical protein
MIVKLIVWMVVITTPSPFHKFPFAPNVDQNRINLNFSEIPETPAKSAFWGFFWQPNRKKWLKPCPHAENLLYNRIAHLVNHQGKPP